MQNAKDRPIYSMAPGKSYACLVRLSKIFKKESKSQSMSSTFEERLLSNTCFINEHATYSVLGLLDSRQA